MRRTTRHIIAAFSPIYLLVLMAFLLLPATNSHAQVIDESNPMTSTWTGVGADSADYAAQSFVANISRVRKIGVWLQKDSANSEVRIALMKDNGFNRPDLNFVLYESTLITPSTNGGWVYDSSFSNVLTVGEKYWLVVDGYNNFTATGYVRIGTSNVFTDTGDPLRYSTDAGNSWASLPGIPMTIFIEGDNCSFNLVANPSSAVVCPDTTVTLSVPNGYVSYAWSSGQTSSTIYAGNPGPYTVTVVDVNNCTAITSVVVSQGVVPIPQLQSYYEFCDGNLLALGIPPFYAQYLWSDGSTSNQDTFSTSGTYWVRVTSSAGCVGTDTFDINVFELPPLPNWNDTTRCVGDTITFDAGPDNTTYIWSTGVFTQTVDISSLTSLWVQVTDTNNCVSRSDTVLVQFSPLPSRPIIQNLPTGLHSSFANSFQWYFNGQLLVGATSQDYPNPVAGEYQVIIENAFGCSASSNPFIVEEAAPGDFISGGISPNGDAYNDAFYIEGVSRYANCKMTVFNRWGELVFEAEHYNNDWYGTNKNGNPLPDGNYFVVIEFGDARETYRGPLMISR